MKLFYQDNGWCGSIVVIAENEKKARELMSTCQNYEPDKIVEEHKIKKGLCLKNYGDM